MNKKHEKSVCCHEKSIHWGKKRRRCVRCGKTWSVWKKQRGRKKKRVDTKLARAFLNRDIASLSSIARKRNCSPAHMQNMLKKSRDLFTLVTPWQPVPRGQLIMVADAVIEYVGSHWHTAYLMLVRATDDTESVILPPLIIRGTETADGWQQAIDSLQESVRKRVVALVCDGHNGLLTEAKWRGWLLQRCHFHLLARIQSRRSRWKIARHKAEAEKIFHHVRHILEHPNESELTESLSILEEIGWVSTSPEIRKVLSGFVRNFRDYRLYLKYPNLHLPTTNNTAESLASSIANLKYRMRGFPTLDSFTRWIIALLKFKKKVTCNGFHQQN